MNLDAIRRLENENEPEPEPETVVEVEPPAVIIPIHMLPAGTTISVTIVIGQYSSSTE